MPLKVSEIVLMWPLKIFFILFSITLFYNFAIINGTMEKIAMHTLYTTRNKPGLLPLVIFFLAIILAAMGAGFYAIMAFLTPLALMLSEKTGMSRLLVSLAVACGAVTGSGFVTSVTGIIIKELITQAGYAEQAYAYTYTTFISTFIVCALTVGGYYIISKGYKLKKFEIAKPEAFNREQRINLYLIAAVVLIIIVPSLLYTFAPKVMLLKLLSAKMDVGFVGIIASIIALLFRIGDEKQVLSKVPWGTIIMICGVGVLIAIGVKAGTLKILASWVGSNVPIIVVPLAVIVIAGCMSFFSSTAGVVLPTLYPLVPGIALASGINPSLLFTLILLGAISTGMSPFSSGGSFILASAPTEEARKALFPKLLFVLPPVQLLITVLFAYAYMIFF